MIIVEATEAPMRVAMSGRIFTKGNGIIVGILKQ